MANPVHACPYSRLMFCFFGAALSVRPVNDALKPLGETFATVPEASLLDENDDKHYSFGVNAEAFRGLDPFEEWSLYSSPTCSGEAAASFRMIPWVSRTNPLNESNVTIVVGRNLTWEKDILFVGAEGLGKCLAFVRQPQPQRQVMQIVNQLPALLRGRLQVFLSMNETIAIHFRAAFALVLVSVVFITFWSIRITVKALTDRRRHWGLTAESESKPSQLRPSPTSEIWLRAFANTFYFLLGCAIFVVQGQAFFRKYKDASATGYIMVLAFPLVFGCPGILRLFMAAARSHLYFCSLRHGLLLQLRDVKLSGDWMLLWLWAGVFLTIGRAMQVVYLNHGANVGIEDFKAIGLLVSPIFYMKKSLADMSRIEEVALNRECKVALEGLDSGFVQIGDEKGIKAMDESAFVTLARHRKEIHAGSPQSGDLERSLNVGDVRWIGFVARDQKSTNRLLSMLLGPALVAALLGLATLSMTVIFLNLTATPVLADLRPVGGFMWPGFSPNIKKYWVGVDYSRRVFGMAAGVDLAKTTEVRVQAFGKPQLNSTSPLVSESLSFDGAIYPQEVNISVDDTVATSSYFAQVFQFAVLPESITVSGHTASDKDFSQCISWGYLYFNNTIRLPQLQNLSVTVSYGYYEMSSTWRERSNNSFSTYFDPEISPRGCEEKKGSIWAQSVFSRYSGSGCFMGMQPRWSSCGKIQPARTQRALQILGANVNSSLCASRSASRSASNGSLPRQQCFEMHDSGTAATVSFGNNSEVMPMPGNDVRINFHMYLNLPSGVVAMLSRYAPRGGFTFTTSKREVKETFRAASGFAKGIEVDGDGLKLSIKDSAALANTTFLEVTIFSEDVACYIGNLSLKNTTMLTPIPTPDRVCEENQMADVCKDGWKPSSSFALPLSFFKEYLWKDRFVKIYGQVIPFKLLGQATCGAMNDIEEPFDSQQVQVELHFEQVPEFQVVPILAGEELQPESSSESWKSPDHCVIDLRRAFAKGKSSIGSSNSSMYIMLAMRKDCGFELRHALEISEDSDGFVEEEPLEAKEVSMPKELCGLSSLNVTKDCGGYLEPITIQIQLANLADLRAWKIESTISCRDSFLPEQNVTLELLLQEWVTQMQ